jgi:hypothetical protein
MSTKRKVKLADVLWDAANERLWSGEGTSWLRHYQNTFSCCAVADACDSFVSEEVVIQFLRRLGCPVRSENQTFGTRDVKARQGARYFWLLLAMHVAEDEGIEIEVDE